MVALQSAGSVLTPGFPDPVHGAQGVFRAAMDALSRPGTLQPLSPDILPPDPPAPLTVELAGLALALADPVTPLWLDAPLAAVPAVAAWLRFHTGAPVVDEPARATFALIADPVRCPPFGAFAQGEPAYPDRSATLLVALDRLDERGGLRLRGPGIRGTARLSADPVPADWAARLVRNRAGFPLGIDLILAAPGRVAGLPRSVEVEA